MDISKKVIIITGAGSGIGRALAVGFCRDGARVMGMGRTEANLAETSKLCEGQGMDYIVGDVTSEKDVNSLVDRTIEKYVQIDILINNAGVYPQNKFVDSSYEEWAKVIEINLLGAALCC